MGNLWVPLFTSVVPCCPEMQGGFERVYLQLLGVNPASLSGIITWVCAEQPGASSTSFLFRIPNLLFHQWPSSWAQTEPSEQSKICVQFWTTSCFFLTCSRKWLECHRQIPFCCFIITAKIGVVSCHCLAQLVCWGTPQFCIPACQSPV